MADGHEKWNNDEIASHLKSAVETRLPMRSYQNRLERAAAFIYGAAAAPEDVPENAPRGHSCRRLSVHSGSVRRRCALAEHAGGIGDWPGCKPQH